MSERGEFDDFRFFMDTLTLNVKLLDSLVENFFFTSVHKYILQSIFNTLSIISDFSDSPRLDQSELKLLTENCVKVIKIVQDDSTWCYECNWLDETRIAIKILILIAEQPFVEPDSRELLVMMESPLVTMLKMPMLGFMRGELGKVFGLSAHCLARSNFRNIMTPDDTYNLIKDVVLPKTISYFTTEIEKNTNLIEDLTYNNFLGLSSCHEKVLDDKYQHAYPLLVGLLVALANHSEARPSGGYIKEFNSMLDEARETGEFTVEHMIALCVIEANGGRVESDQSPNNSRPKFKEWLRILFDLLSKSKGIHRFIIAHMIWKRIKDNEKRSNELRKLRDKFFMTMIDDLITKNDKQLNELLSRALGVNGTSYDFRMQLIQADQIESLVAGKEMAILKKLVESGAQPTLFHQLISLFKPIEDRQLSAEFDELAKTPISNAINSLEYFLGFDRRNGWRRWEFTFYYYCLVELLRLRRHPLAQDIEEKLIGVFDLLVRNDFIINNSQGNSEIILIFANSYKVRSTAWNSIIEFLTKFHRSEICGEDLSGLDAINKTLAHFLMTDADYFYEEVASIEIIKLIYKHSHQAVNAITSDCDQVGVCLLKEILLTWPRELEKTKLDASEHREMLNQFIELLITELKTIEHTLMSSAPLFRMNINVLVDRLSGLLMAYSRHRGVLYDALDKQGNEGAKGIALLRRNFLMWAQLIIGGAIPRGPPFPALKNLKGYSKLAKLSDIVVAHEGLMIIRENSFACDQLTRLSGALSKAIESALNRKLESAPIGSIESKRLHQIRASLRPRLAAQLGN